MRNGEFTEWVAKSKGKPCPRQLVAAYNKRDQIVTMAQTAGWQTWLRKTDEERAQLTLRADDGT